MQDSFDYKGTLYVLKDSLRFGEVRQINQNLSFVTEINQRFGNKLIDEIPPNEVAEILVKGRAIENEQLQMVANVLYRCLGLEQEALNKLVFEDAMMLFFIVYQKSTILKKKSAEQSQSPTSSTT